MTGKRMLEVTGALLVFVAVSCVLSEASWSAVSNQPDPLRELIAMPSIAEGNLNPSARSPGLELYCSSLNDIPGGYCYYYSQGVPAWEVAPAANVTVVSR